MTNPPSRGLLLACLLAQLAYGLLAMTICIPSMAQWPATFGSSQAAVQLSFSGYAVAYGGLQLLYGPWSDRLGRRRILLTGLALAALGSAVAALAPGLALLVAGRVLQGAGAAAGMVVGRAMVQDLFHGPERTRVMAWIGMTMGLCPPLATLVGGQLHVALGWQANFVLMTGLALALLAVAWRVLPGGRPGAGVGQAGAAAPLPGGRGGVLAAYARLAREPGFAQHVFVLAMTTATFYAFLGGAPLVLGSLGVGPQGLGLYIMVIPGAYIAGNYLTTHLAHRSSARAIMAMGQGLTLAGIALMLTLALAGWRAPLAFALPLMLLGLGHGLLVPPTLSGTVGLVPALAGTAAAVTGLAQQLLGAAGAWAVGWFSHDGAVHLGWLMLAFSAAGALAQALLPRHARPAG